MKKKKIGRGHIVWTEEKLLKLLKRCKKMSQLTTLMGVSRQRAHQVCGYLMLYPQNTVRLQKLITENKLKRVQEKPIY